MTTRITSEMQFAIWDDDQGCCIKICRDADGLDMVQVKPGDKEAEDFWGKLHLVLPPKLARAVAKAILAVADDIEKENGPEGPSS